MFKFKARDLYSIPNILSYFRIILCFVFVFVYRQDISYKSLYLAMMNDFM